MDVLIIKKYALKVKGERVEAKHVQGSISGALAEAYAWIHGKH
jgi:hypothetical protein